MAPLNRDQMTSTAKRKLYEVDAAEWYGEGACVYIRPMSAAAGVSLEELRGENKGYQLITRTCLLSLCEPDGALMFADNEADYAILNKSVPIGLQQRVFDRALEVNAMKQASAEELEKNLETTPSDSSA